MTETFDLIGLCVQCMEQKAHIIRLSAGFMVIGVIALALTAWLVLRGPRR